MIVVELASFVTLWFELINEAEKDASNAMGHGLAFSAGIFFLVLPVLVGAWALLKFRRPTAEQE